MNKVIILIVAIVICNLSNGQFVEHYFSDNEQKHNGKIFCTLRYENSIIIGGMSFEYSQRQPTIIRIDSLGNTLWNTGITDSTQYNPVYYLKRISHIILGNDGFIYAYCAMDNYEGEFWKVDPFTGAIIWRKSFNYFYNDRHIQNIVDYDSTSFLITYFHANTPDGFDVKIGFVNKTNGDTISNHHIGFADYSEDGLGVCIDSQKNIYYTCSDSIFKSSPYQPDNVTWRTRYNSIDMLEYNHIYYDSIRNNLVIMGMKDGVGAARILNINATNAAVNGMSSSQSNNENANFQDMKIRGDTLFITWKQTVVGGGSFRFWTTKYNMNTKSVIWNSSINFNNAGGGQGGLSIDLDSSNNIFLAGYYDADNWEPANWAVLKLSGTNGSVLYEKIIKEDTLLNDDLSAGNGIFLINNQPCLVGQIQTSHDDDFPRSKLAFYKLENATGNIISHNYIEGKYQFPSNTIDIQKSISGTIVLKQLGRFISIEKYDAGKNLVWIKTISKEYYLKGHTLDVSPNDNILVAATIHNESNVFPYYNTNDDSLIVFKIDALGNIIQTSAFYSSFDLIPVELNADATQTFLYYKKNSFMYHRRINSSGFSNEGSTGMTSYPNLSPNKYWFNASDQFAFLFGTLGSNRRVLKLDKNNLSHGDIDAIPLPLYRINYVYDLDSIRAVLCGKNNFNQESIGIYSTVLLDTVWTKVLDTLYSSQVVKCISDISNNYLYTLSQNSNNIMIRKLSVSNGEQEWQANYNGSANLSDYPLDIVLDEFRHELIVSGYETGISNDKNVVILILDTAGIFSDTIVRVGDFSGDNIASCCEVLIDGSQWVGGNLNTFQDGPAGFIYEINGSTCSSSTSNLNLSGCDNIIWNNQVYQSSGLYQDTILNFTGCDSVVSLNLTITNSSSNSQTVTNCENYFWNGNFYNTTGIFYDTLLNSIGCDSILTLDLTINNVDVTVNNSGDSLTSSAIGATYQWLDCNSGFIPISGENLATFHPTLNGDYAVIVTQNGCTDTSSCYNYFYNGMNESNETYPTNIYPNPSNGNFFLQINSNLPIVNGLTYVINDLSGKKVATGKIMEHKSELNPIDLSNGIYYLSIVLDDRITMNKLTIIK
jgi:hypothetical protein